MSVGSDEARKRLETETEPADCRSDGAQGVQILLTRNTEGTSFSVGTASNYSVPPLPLFFFFFFF